MKVTNLEEARAYIEALEHHNRVLAESQEELKDTVAEHWRKIHKEPDMPVEDCVERFVNTWRFLK